MLDFTGHCSINAGDRIKAYVQEYEEIGEVDTGRMLGGEKVYHPIYDKKHPLTQRERASKIERLDEDGHTLANFIGLDNEPEYKSDLHGKLIG